MPACYCRPHDPHLPGSPGCDAADTDESYELLAPEDKSWPPRGLENKEAPRPSA